MTESRILSGRLARAATLCLLALAAALLRAGEARAQWTQPDANNNISNTNAGNVGVGTSSPAAKLVVRGNSSDANSMPGVMFENSADALQRRVRVQNYFPGLTYFTANDYRDPATQTWQLDNPTRGSAGMILNTADWTGTGMRNYLQLWATPNGAPGPWYGLVLWDSGKLTVNKPVTVGMPTEAGLVDILGTGSTAATASLAVSNSNSASLLYVRDDGNVGVGTSSPAAKVHADVNSASAGADSISAGNRGVTSLGHTSGLRFQFNTAVPAAIRARLTSLSSGAADLGFYTSGDGTAASLVERMTVTSGGNVGIGTAAPSASYRLDVNGAAHVAGDMTIDGNIAAKFQDVAEWVPSTQKLQAGTVVVLDRGGANHVLASTTSYDTAVAGVISERPGIALGERGEGKVLVATTGRVKVKVDAARAPIKVGDLLVTSGVEGVAMKSVPVDLGGTLIHRPGTIIGKALEPLEKGTGEILVLLSLQ